MHTPHTGSLHLHGTVSITTPVPILCIPCHHHTPPRGTAYCISYSVRELTKKKNVTKKIQGKGGRHQKKKKSPKLFSTFFNFQEDHCQHYVFQRLEVHLLCLILSNIARNWHYKHMYTSYHTIVTRLDFHLSVYWQYPNIFLNQIPWVMSHDKAKVKEKKKQAQLRLCKLWPGMVF